MIFYTVRCCISLNSDSGEKVHVAVHMHAKHETQRKRDKKIASMCACDTVNERELTTASHRTPDRDRIPIPMYMNRRLSHAEQRQNIPNIKIY